MTFLLIGDGPLREKIKKGIQKHRMEDHFLMLGRQPREKVREYLWASDIYLTPTIYEAFGIAVLEAQAVGLPVVAHNHGGVGEIVIDGVTGILSEDDDQLVEGVVTLIENDELRNRMGIEARRRIPERFSWENVAGSIVDVYKKTIDTFDENYYLIYRVHQRLLGGRKI